MPNTRTAPRRAARRIARQRLRESGRQLAIAQPVDVPIEIKDVEDWCTGCDRPLHPHPNYRRVRGVRQYCELCRDLALPTNGEIVAIVARAFDVVAAVARRDGDALEKDSLAEAVARAASLEHASEFPGLDADNWEHLAGVWERLAYRPRVAV